MLDATITAAIAAAAQATEAVPAGSAVIDVLVNGDVALADAAARRVPEHEKQGAQQRAAPHGDAAAVPAPRLRIWHLALADKAHAWNQYLEVIWPGAGLAFFVDGYVRLWPATIERIARHVRACPDAIGGTGVPTVGRSAAAATRAMLESGGIQGNCFCITGPTLLQMRQSGFRLPLGLYRGDAMIGAVLAYRLDPAKNQWDSKRAVPVVPTASWDMKAARLWRPADWRAMLRRRDRQAQGELENLAMREHLTLRRQPPQALPATAAELVLGWAERCPEAARDACRRNSRIARALTSLRTPRDWRAAATAPTLIADSGASA